MGRRVGLGGIRIPGPSSASGLPLPRLYPPLRGSLTPTSPFQHRRQGFGAGTVVSAGDRNRHLHIKHMYTCVSRAHRRWPRALPPRKLTGVGPGRSRSLQGTSGSVLWDGMGPRSGASRGQRLRFPPGCQMATPTRALLLVPFGPGRSPLSPGGQGSWGTEHLAFAAAGGKQVSPAREAGWRGRLVVTKVLAYGGPGGKCYCRDRVRGGGGEEGAGGGLGGNQAGLRPRGEGL